MEISINEADLQAVIGQLANENTMLKLNNTAMSRTILEMEKAAEKPEKKKK